RARIPAVGAIALRFRPWLEKMLHPAPANRLESMLAVANWQIGATRGSKLRRTERRPPAAQPGRARRFWRRAAAILPFIALIAGAGAFYYYGTNPPLPPPPPPPTLADTPRLH